VDEQLRNRIYQALDASETGSVRSNLADAIGEVIEIGVVMLEHVGDTSQGTFPPIATARTADGNSEVWDFFDDAVPPEDWEDLARKFLADIDPATRFVTLMYDGMLTMDDVTTPALFVEGYELGQMNGVQVAQSYDLTDGLYRHMGNPEVLDSVLPLVPNSMDISAEDGDWPRPPNPLNRYDASWYINTTARMHR